MTDPRQAGSGHAAYVTKSEYGDFLGIYNDGNRIHDL
jgi:hypothetical protein